jgi:hypothetical protein
MGDGNFVPLCGPAYQMPLERGKVYEFARAVGSTHPAHFASVNPVIPPTFLTTAGFFWGYTLETAGENPFARLEVDRSMLLHAEEEYEFPSGPPRAGQTLTARSRVVDVTRKAGRRGGALTFIKIETEFRTPSYELVARSRTTVVSTGQPTVKGNLPPHE